MSNPNISVIVPCYKVECYLKACLDSLIGQTYHNWEAICVDDGSPDNSGKILEEYAKKDNRIKVIHQENQGLSVARNNGKKLAKGDYIYFLDSDDAIHPQLLEVTYELSKKYNADLVNFDCYNSERGMIERKQQIDVNKMKVKVTDNPIFQGCYKNKYRIHINAWNKLYKRELLDGIEFIPGIHFEDFPHTYAVLSRKPRTVITTEKLYYYRPNEGSISRKDGNPKQIKDYYVGVKSVCEIYKASELKKELWTLF